VSVTRSSRKTPRRNGTDLKNRGARGNVEADVLAYIVKRVLWAAVVFVAITASTFVLFFIVPTNSVQSNVRGRDITSSLSGNVRLHGSVPSQYLQFLGRIFTHGSMGRAAESREDVNSVLARAIPITASVVIGGAVLWLLIAIPVGILSALRPRSLLDRGAMIFVLIGISAHPIWLGLILSYVFSYKLHLLPAGGYCDVVHPAVSENCGGLTQWAYHLILPWITFAMLFAALYVRMIRAVVVETFDQDYVRTARAKGASEWRILRSHVLRNAFLPVVTMLGMDVGVAFGGSVFVESVFGLPGLGHVALRALIRQDLAPMLGVIVTVTVTILVLNLVVDLLYAWLDPRIGLSTAPTDEGETRSRLRTGGSLAASPSA
jgi:peptide/nickel transport system permease protein